VIKKDQLLEQARSSVASIANEIEKAVDEILRKHVAANGVKGHVVYEQGVLDDSVMEELARRYTENNYRAEHRSDQREGGWLQIWLD
jgi:hypothetical protein